MSVTANKLPTVLMVAYHFPPLAGSSGIQRTLRFVQQLPAHGWQPLVLTAHPQAYTATSADLLAQVPADVPVCRAFALDASRHLSISGRYPSVVALPDRWASWWLGAMISGLTMVRRHRPQVLWSTYPIATAHRIGLTLSRLTGLPLVADFRDPMAQDGYPTDPRVWRAYDRIEHALARRAARMVFATPSARRTYRARFAHLPAERFELIENGYDEESFADAEKRWSPAPLNPGAFTLLHSGIVYPSERDPRALMAALGQLRQQNHPGLPRLRLRFRAAIHDDLLRECARQYGVEDMIELLPPLPYAAALAEMLSADALLVMQGANCNEQIPAKVYEYLRARRPVIGLADPVGDTAALLHAHGVAHVAKLEDVDAVARCLAAFLLDVAPGAPRSPLDDGIRGLSRSARTAVLARLLDEVSAAASDRHTGKVEARQ